MPKPRAVVLCEGEIDCMTYSQLGISALSVPFGGGKAPSSSGLSTSITTWTASTKIWLSLDNDEVGREAAKEIARRLGEHRCRSGGAAV
ncbi:DNA primase (bacterial type) [Klebsiella pneumoniae]|uniref:DNA primase (Bacterial type) n=1 Tax=Klebsiella pneumoniae TaxID=573 RepID=A0A2X3F5H5_KLEPN|nr:DNA primase (bacterial type) [Klebsiella pneumoniae]